MEKNRITKTFLVDVMKAPAVIESTFYNHWSREYYEISHSRQREILTEVFVWTKKLINFYNKKFNKDFKINVDKEKIFLDNTLIFELDTSGRKCQNIRPIIEIAKEIVNNNLLNEFLEYLDKKDVVTIFDVYKIVHFLPLTTKDIIKAMKIMNKDDMKIIMITTDHYNVFEYCNVRTISFWDAWKEGLIKFINGTYHLAKVGNKPVILAFKGDKIFVIYDSDVLLKILMEHERG